MTQDRWADLPLRLASAIVLLLIFVASLYVGRKGVLALGLVAAVAMQWELARMFGLSGRRLLAVTVVAAVGWLPMAVPPMILTQSLPLAAAAGLLPILLAAAFIAHNRMVYIGYGALLTLGMLSFWFLALTFGAIGIAILAAVVILSDIGGYIAGRLMGGPKFWPAISPKKPGAAQWQDGRWLVFLGCISCSIQGLGGPFRLRSPWPLVRRWVTLQKAG